MRSAALALSFVLGFLWLFGTTNTHAETIVIKDDRGGLILEYLMRYEYLGRTGAQIVVDGDCLSACTLVLGYIPADRLCFTPAAKFGFHAAWSKDKDGQPVYSEPGTTLIWQQYPPWIRSWLHEQGGLTQKMLYLQGKELAAMYNRCDSLLTEHAEQTASEPLRIVVRPKPKRKPVAPTSVIFHAHGLY